MLNAARQVNRRFATQIPFFPYMLHLCNSCCKRIRGEGVGRLHCVLIGKEYTACLVLPWGMQSPCHVREGGWSASQTFCGVVWVMLVGAFHSQQFWKSKIAISYEADELVDRLGIFGESSSLPWYGCSRLSFFEF
jgi:hypothetical protein